MTYSVSPTVDRPTHDVLITDSTGAQVGLVLCDLQGNTNMTQWNYGPLPATAVQIYQGNTKYSDTPPPWTPVVQSDWSGGRGSKDFDRDQSKYYDGYRINTTRTGEVLPGPWDNWATGINSWTGYWGGLVTVPAADGAGISFRNLANTIIKTADSFVAQTTSMAFVWAVLGYVGTPATLDIKVYTDSAGSPDTSTNVAHTTLAYTAMLNGGSPETVRLALAASGMTATNTYWLSFESTGSTSYWRVGNASVTSASFKDFTSSWAETSGYSFLFRICQAEDQFKAHFVNYKNNVFAGLEYDDGGFSKVYMNGDQGAATSGSSTAMFDTGGMDWTADYWNGAIVTFNENTASEQPTNWALITDTSSAAQSVTYAAMDVAPAAQTLYSIIGTPRWTSIDTSTAASPNWDESTAIFSVHDALSVNHGILFTGGDSTSCWRLRFYNSGGTWTTEWIKETEAQFGYLQDANDQSGAFIWGGTYGFPAKINFAASRDWSGTAASSTVLDFSATAINCGDVGERITKLITYGEYGNLFVMKEGSIYQVVDKQPYKLGLAQYGNSRDRRNGVAAVAHNVYLYFSYHNTVLRYFNGQVDNIGPTRDEEGLPDDRLGPVADMVGYENLVIAAFDGGDANYSCIMAYNGMGWCEWYRPPSVGLRIRSLHVETLPGNFVDRLWFSCGSDIGWLTLSGDPFNHPVDLNNLHTNYLYAVDSHYITSYFYFNKQDSDKVFKNIRGIIDQVTDSVFILYVDYRLDNTATWTPLANYISSFYDTLTLSSTYNVTGRRIQFRIKIYNQFFHLASRLVATIMEALVQQDFKYYFDLTFRIADKDRDLNGHPDDRATAASKFDMLTTWAGLPDGLLVSTRSAITDNKYYKIDPLSLKMVNKVTRENRSYLIARCRLYQLS